MFGALKKSLLKMAASANSLKDFACPHCGHHFSPFAEKPPTDWQERIVCPKCGYSLTFIAACSRNKNSPPDVPVPTAQPPASRIERKQVSNTELLFYIPASGRCGGLLVFTIMWNAVAWPVFIAFTFLDKTHNRAWLFAVLFSAIFPLIGLGMIYFALRNRFAVHLLYLSPERVRLQRQLFSRQKNFDLPTAQIESIRRAEFYQQNYQPVYGVEIKGGGRRIRFGSILTNEEKDWLCWEIAGFVRPYAPRLAS